METGVKDFIDLQARKVARGDFRGRTHAEGCGGYSFQENSSFCR